MGTKRARRVPKSMRRKRRRPWYFRLILILFPFLLLGLIEGVLHLTGIARPPSLFLEKEAGLVSYLQPNPEIGKRFFPPSLASVMPKPNFQVLPAKKDTGTKRILCLGESTTAGFPFPVHGSFPAILRQILTEREPGQDWEVTNCGLTAISSASVADLIDELLATDPDALVVYMGHNEFYGAGGVASQSSGVVRYIAPLRRLRLARLIEGVVSRPDIEAIPGTLMQRIVNTARVEPDSPLRERAYRNFTRNLEKILEAASESGVRVVLCEVVSKERDLFPFGSSNVVAEDLGNIAREVAGWPLGRPSIEAAERSLPELDDEVVRDSFHAGLRYLRGVARLALADSGAIADLRDARNLDVVPFRAPDAINEIVRDAGQREGVVLVPVEEIFRLASEHGIPGEDLFVEHLHPTFLGASLIASAAADAVLGGTRNPVSPADAGRWLRGSGLSRVDLDFADARIKQLLARWPYSRSGVQTPPFAYHAPSLRAEAGRLVEASGGDSAMIAYFRGSRDDEEAAVRALLSHQTDILAAHRGLARAALERGELVEAAYELHAAAQLFPVDASLWLDLGEIRLQLGDSAGAATAAQNALDWIPSSSKAQEILRRSEQMTTPPSDGS